jgi:Kef-type K+ transport system membrane component KefB
LLGGRDPPLFDRGERRTIVSIILGGILVSFVLGLLLVSIIDTGTLRGPNADPESFALVFGIAIAITSIPVISRVLFDLGVIGTSFSRVVLGAAVAEDVVLYVALAVALGLLPEPTTQISRVHTRRLVHPSSPGALESLHPEPR